MGRTRTRTKGGEPTSGTAYYKDWDPSKAEPDWEQTVSIQGPPIFTETMRDRVGFPHKWNPCFHEVARSQPIEGGYSFEFPNGWLGKRKYTGHYVPNGYARPPGADPAKLAQAHHDALASFGGELEPQILAPNFLYELPELRRLGDGIITRRSPLIRRVAAAHLGWNFAIRPFFGDLVTLNRLVKQVDERIDWHRENSGKPVTVNYQADVTPDHPANPQPPHQSTAQWVDWRLSHSVTYFATAKVIFEMPQRSRLEDRTRYLASVMGFDRPLSVAWEATPYSFVVDWIYDVGSLTDEFNLNAWGVQYNVLSCGFSTYETYATEKRNYAQYQGTINSGVYASTGTADYAVYHRHVGIPAGSPFPSPELPGLRELLLGLSLFVQRAT